MEPIGIISLFVSAWDIVKTMLPNKMAKDIKIIDKRIGKLSNELFDTQNEIESIKAILLPISVAIYALLQEAKSKNPNFQIPNNFYNELLLDKSIYSSNLTERQDVVVKCARCKGSGKDRSYSPLGWFDPDDPNVCPSCGGSGVKRL